MPKPAFDPLASPQTGGTDAGSTGTSQPAQTATPGAPTNPQTQQAPGSGATTPEGTDASDPNALPSQLTNPQTQSTTQPNQPDQQTLGSGGLPSGLAGASPTEQSEAPDESRAGGSLIVLSEEEREKVRKLVLAHNIVQTESVNFPLRLGARIPPNVKLLPFPREVIEIVPEYRDYSYVVANDRIVVVKTDRREIDSLIPT